MQPEREDVNEALKEYESQHLTYAEMSCLLKKYYGKCLSTNAIRKRLKRIGVPCRRGPTLHSIADIKMLIEQTLPEHSVTVGYRYMTDYLRRKGMHVRRDSVMNIMREVGPVGVQLRRRRRIQRKVYSSMGPNHVWHVDGYDKLKPYGFPINGCIDGYSRRILWLKVGPTNNDPKIVAQNFLAFVESIEGCPLILQADPGTENSDMGAIQCTLRHDATDCFSGLSSFRVVKSVFNQRIEAWWSMFRRQKSEWWMQFFRDLAAFGLFRKGNQLDLYCIRYCFMPLLQRELDALLEQWNSHYISQSRQASCPNGHPTVLYHLPTLTGAEDCICRTTGEDIEFLYTLHLPTSRTGSEDFDSYARRIFDIHSWSDAANWEEALYQYFNLLTAQL